MCPDPLRRHLKSPLELLGAVPDHEMPRLLFLPFFFSPFPSPFSLPSTHPPCLLSVAVYTADHVDRTCGAAAAGQARRRRFETCADDRAHGPCRRLSPLLRNVPAEVSVWRGVKGSMRTKLHRDRSRQVPKHRRYWRKRRPRPRSSSRVSVS